MKITVIPLDSRPCNTEWISDYAKMANIELSMYPTSLCGNLHVPANIKQMTEWLDKEVMDTDYLILSADGFCSGGLVQSRSAKFSLTDVKQKLVILKRFKTRYSKLKIMVFDTLMRTSITSFDPESEYYWGKMNEYSRLVGRLHFFQDTADSEKMKLLETEIPQTIIQTYLDARSKKHQLNLHFLSLLAKKVIDYLLILQEDAMPYGMQQIEQQILLKQITKLKIADRVKFYNGTDEGGVVLLAKVILEIFHRKPLLYIHVPQEAIMGKIMPFEDRPLQENLNLMLDTIGFLTTDTLEDADFVLSIYSEIARYDLEVNTTKQILPQKDGIYEQYIQELNTFIATGKNVAFVDLLFPNGGSIDLLKDIHFEGLRAYSAWNTASNSFGSCLCEIAVLCTNKIADSKKMLYQHIIDDCVYQYIVRRRINQKYLAEGKNIYDLSTSSAYVLTDIIEQMKQETMFLGDVLYKLYLPWNRTFEIGIEMEE